MVPGSRHIERLTHLPGTWAGKTQQLKAGTTGGP